jgi:hypothetical protein
MKRFLSAMAVMALAAAPAWACVPGNHVASPSDEPTVSPSPLNDDQTLVYAATGGGALLLAGAAAAALKKTGAA